jgi:hypothetical protein
MNFGQAFAAARKRGDKTFEFNGKKFTTQVKGEIKSLQQPLPVDPIVALKTKAMPAKKQLVRPKKLRWPKPVRCASKQILAMFQQMFVAPKRRQLRASAVT